MVELTRGDGGLLVDGTTPEDFKELVRSRTDIVQLIGETISLQPQQGGRVFKGLCPFHQDHNPSFTVNPERQSYKCWVCNEGGDCFSFLMKHDKAPLLANALYYAEAMAANLTQIARTVGG